ncbi:hypothetical protein HPB48_006775 [Haemaphysalis longicornis]|uniref:Endonuclease/exonuclease/phosphatase domain-containing protein n=1 Tax=Haemaphysalis longicornis TaxID=44386 RepID=A0A9J6FFA2_HAELO|nr:hypothetical protein HPB48_006775 [Haemaphysalis longicornis]
MTNGNSGVIIIQWHCRGFPARKAVVHRHIRHAACKPDVNLLQETLMAAPTLTGSRQPLPTIEGKGQCTPVRKGPTFVDHELGGVQADHSFVEVIPAKCGKQSIFLLNVYRNPSKRRKGLRALLQLAISTTMSRMLIPGADFTAAEAEWGYGYNTAKGENLAQDTHALDFALITDPALSTRLGNLATRDAIPELTFITNTETATVTCSNTMVDLGSDHAFVEIHV